VRTLPVLLLLRALIQAAPDTAQSALSRGDYHAAIERAGRAATLHRKLHDDARLAEDLNTLGLANLYLANYPAALDYYEQARRLDRASSNRQGEVARLNNIGNVFYFQGRYLDALRAYEEALGKVNAASNESWYARRRQLTVANLATLHQRLGQEQRALDFYRELAPTPQSMPPSEYAQLLLNQGVLYRRLGDPVKALELYRASQALFVTERHRDGEIGALRNIGIARALDLADLPGALDAFTAALQLARQSSNQRGLVQARLYRAEVLRRLNRLGEAKSDLRAACDGAHQAGLVEEQWKTLYALGRIEEAAGHRDAALDAYGQAAAIVESVRVGLRISSLKSEFLADKRDIYDAMIALRLRESAPPMREIFRWMEHSRARTLADRVGSAPSESTLEAVQSRLRPDQALLEFWSAGEDAAMIWITSTAAGLAPIQDPTKLPPNTPIRPSLIIVPDGRFNSVAFEALPAPVSGKLLVEESAVSYLPSAQFLLRSRMPRRWLPPWHRVLVAFGDPPVSPSDTLAIQERWQRLSASGDEVRGIARLLSGRADLHLGADAHKQYLLSGRISDVPILHFATHAVVDPENPDRSRLLLASDYLFEGDVYNLKLQGVDLVTLSACETARGKAVGGEGTEAFTRAFLGAGAAATVTSLWRVADQPAAEFMQQFYYFLAQGRPKAEALRAAKLRFLHSGSRLADPRHWAAFVLYGDGWNPCPRVIPWSALLIAAALLTLALGLGLHWRKRNHGARRVVCQKTEHLNRAVG
jgi:CHAT domain-containing protein/tetratricopeptide (TPR) repeat protein